MKNKISKEMQVKAMQVAKGTQKKGQTKAQTKLIVQGIEKGIAEYKKQQSKKYREIDKQRKQQVKQQKKHTIEYVQNKVCSDSGNTVNKLPWILLVVSWLGFVGYLNNYF